MESSDPITPQELRKVHVLADLSDKSLEWLIDHGVKMEFAGGELVAPHGARVEWMYLLLEGEAIFYWANSGDAPYITRAGEIVGALPYSRQSTYNGYGIAGLPIRSLSIHRDQFPAMLEAIPELGQRLIGLMVDRVREITRLDLRSEKLMSLGKLSAGLAHELGNPTAAAHRSAAQFKETLPALQQHTLKLVEELGPQTLRRLLEAVKTLKPTPYTPLGYSDLEQSLGDWLETHGAPDLWNSLPTLIEAGVEPSWMEKLEVSGLELTQVVWWLEAYLNTQTLARDIEICTERISGIVMAVKRYTHMDQTPRHAVDIQQGLEDTLTLFGNEFRQGIRLEKFYDPQLPRIEGYGSELNQVWTNLIANALEAMRGVGTLRIQAIRENSFVLVEVMDTGPGIPATIRDKIFDPFFTTKEVGKGTGLGLDTVRRIVQRHRGSLRVESEPGNTRFQVRLPLDTAGLAEQP